MVKDMKENFGAVQNELKAIIDKEGKGYLAREPYGVYETLLEQNDVGKRAAGAVLLTLIAGVPDRQDILVDEDVLAKVIQEECLLNEEVSRYLSIMYKALFSEENEKHWSEKELSGLHKFMENDCRLHWSGETTWEPGGGFVVCHYEADIVLQPLATCADDRAMKAMLADNPFTEASAIERYFADALKAQLDYKFEEYCTEDDYYQPVVEDFEIDYYVNEWCKLYGFEIVSCEGSGEDEGYETGKKFW